MQLSMVRPTLKESSPHLNQHMSKLSQNKGHSDGKTIVELIKTEQKTVEHCSFSSSNLILKLNISFK